MKPDSGPARPLHARRAVNQAWYFVSGEFERLKRLEERGAITAEEAAKLRDALQWLVNSVVQRVYSLPADTPAK